MTVLKPAPLLGIFNFQENEKICVFFVECAELRMLTFRRIVNKNSTRSHAKS